MRQSQLFSKTLKKIGSEKEAISNQLLLKGGFIDQTTAGVYAFLPLGFKVLKKIENIIRKQMEDPTMGAIHYLSPTVMAQKGYTYPKWSKVYKLKAIIEKHKFYKEAKI